MYGFKLIFQAVELAQHAEDMKREMDQSKDKVLVLEESIDRKVEQLEEEHFKLSRLQVTFIRFQFQSSSKGIFNFRSNIQVWLLMKVSLFNLAKDFYDLYWFLSSLNKCWNCFRRTVKGFVANWRNIKSNLVCTLLMKYSWKKSKNTRYFFNVILITLLKFISVHASACMLTVKVY